MRESWGALMGSVRVKEQGARLSRSLESWERLKSSPRPEGSHEGVLESHDGLSPSRKARGKTQRSGRAREDSCRVI